MDNPLPASLIGKMVRLQVAEIQGNHPSGRQNLRCFVVIGYPIGTKIGYDRQNMRGTKHPFGMRRLMFEYGGVVPHGSHGAKGTGTGDTAGISH
jgi:hypothetical protein